MATNPTLLGDWYKDYLAKPPKAETYNAASAGTTNWNVSDNQTVQGQLKGILKSGGPLMEQAATAGAQSANRKGLLNSSMGVQAGQAALYDKALPIASQDANTYGQSAQFNANAANQASIANAGFANDAGRFNAGAQNDMSGMLFRAAADFGLEDKRQTFQAGESAADRAWRTGERIGSETFQTGENALQRSFQTGERVSSQDFSASQATLDRDQQTRMQQLQEQGMDQRQAEQIALQERMQKTDQVFTAEQKAQDRLFTSSERQAIQKFETDRMQAQNAFTERLQVLQEQGMDKRQAQQLAMQEALTKLGEAGVQNRFDAQQALQSDQFSFEQAALDRRMVQQHEQRLKEMGYAAELDNDNVPSSFAASVSSNTMNAVNAISGDPNLDAAAKENAIKNVIENGNATLRWAAITYKTAFPSIPGFGEPPAPAFNVPGQVANYPPNPNMQAGGSGGQVATDGNYVNAV